LVLLIPACQQFGITVMIYAAIEFFHPTQVDPDFHPPITILADLRSDIDTYENFASFCQQTTRVPNHLRCAMSATSA